MSEKIDQAETKAAEYMIRFAATLSDEGRDDWSKEVMQFAIRNFRESCFYEAVAICAGEHD